MDKKKAITLLICIALLSTLVLAQEYKLQVSTKQENFKPGQDITFKVELYDSSTKPINQQVEVIFEDSRKNQIEKTVYTNKFVEANLGEDALAGLWKITATYNDLESTTIFTIQENQLIEFDLQEDVLTIKNIGNSRYSKTIQIAIGDTINPKEVSLEVGQSESIRLIAPDGRYTIKITDGTTTLTRGEVYLTGEAIGYLDQQEYKRSPITGINPEDPNQSAYSLIKDNKFIYIFLVVLVGATILIGIERHYRKKT